MKLHLAFVTLRHFFHPDRTKVKLSEFALPNILHEPNVQQEHTVTLASLVFQHMDQTYLYFGG